MANELSLNQQFIKDELKLMELRSKCIEYNTLSNIEKQQITNSLIEIATNSAKNDSLNQEFMGFYNNMIKALDMMCDLNNVLGLTTFLKQVEHITNDDFRKTVNDRILNLC